jgi:putative membrane protein
MGAGSDRTVSTLFAFLHHLAAFALVAALAVEFVLIRATLDTRTARWLQRADMIYGLSSGLLLVVGLLRVFQFEKGPAYYFHSAPFLAKLLLFLAVGLISIAPTREFLSWRRILQQHQVPVLSEQRRRRLRAIVHLELAGVLLIVLCAALMARGVGYFG